MIKLNNEGKNINVNSLKSHYSSIYQLPEQPKTVDIISAIPEHYKEDLVPYLKTKPVRTASGVSNCVTSVLS